MIRFARQLLAGILRRLVERNIPLQANRLRYGLAAEPAIDKVMLNRSLLSQRQCVVQERSQEFRGRAVRLHGCLALAADFGRNTIKRLSFFSPGQKQLPLLNVRP
jgi:hypothetical protein